MLPHGGGVVGSLPRLAVAAIVAVVLTCLCGTHGWCVNCANEDDNDANNNPSDRAIQMMTEIREVVRLNPGMNNGSTAARVHADARAVDEDEDLSLIHI